MMSIDAQREPDVCVWWIGDDATSARETFIQWVSGADSPRHPASTWRIHTVSLDTRSLPRIAICWPGGQNGPGAQNAALSVVVWAIPKEGIADLLHRIDHVRHSRPGYVHLSVGLASPIEQRFLREVGIRVHVQHPRDWHQYRGALGYSSSPAGRSNSSIAGSS